MPFDVLPSRGINFAPLANIQHAIRPGRPVFPTYEVVMRALDSMLPALDPVERQKRALAIAQTQLAMESLPLQRAKNQLMMQQIPLEQSRIQMEKSIYDTYNKTGKLPIGYQLGKNGIEPIPANTQALMEDRARKAQQTNYGISQKVDAVKGGLQNLPVDPSLGQSPAPSAPPATIPIPNATPSATPPAVPIPAASPSATPVISPAHDATPFPTTMLLVKPPFNPFGNGLEDADIPT